jgi:hypothetical protein
MVLDGFSQEVPYPPVDRPDPEGDVRSAPIGRSKQPKGQHKMKRTILSLVGLLASAGYVQAATLSLVNTGNNGAATGTADPNWSVGGPISGSAYVIADNGVYPFPNWIGSGAGASQWISATPNINTPIGTYTFRTTVDLTGMDPTTASITGKWAADNTGHIAVNGNPVGFPPIGGINTADEGFRDWTPFNLAGVFAPGVNTIDFVVTNLHEDSPLGVRVELSGVVSSGGQHTPEPSTMLICAMAAGAAAWRRRQGSLAV